MYYPKSQIKTNLHTNGGEYVLKSTNIDYQGFFYKISNGKRFTGKFPTNGVDIELIIPQSTIADENFSEEKITLALSNEDPDPMIGASNLSNDSSTYGNLIGNSTLNINPRTIPSHYFPLASPKEQLLGRYTRYFSKKTNNWIYTEISKETYTKFKSKDPTVASDLYECLSIPWSIVDGGERINKNIVSLTERKNRWYGFTIFFRGQFGNP